MSKRTLSREKIVAEAFRMVDENGVDSFSLRTLAARLGVRASALYNHIENENDLLACVAQCAADQYNAYIETEVHGLPPDASAKKAGDAFLQFWSDHKFLYDLFLDRRWMENPVFSKALERFTQPIDFLLEQYGVEDPVEKENLYVVLRVVTHGFASLESLGTFDSLSIDAKESYHRLIKSAIGMMKASGQKGR